MTSTPLKFAFIVQGEGRGHLTQAMVLERVLRDQGHEVCLIMVGKSPRRRIPQFFHDNVQAEVLGFSSPNFVVDEMRRGIKIGATVLFNLLRLPRYLKAMAVLRRKLRACQPDVVVNFYDFLGGLFFALYNPEPALICVGHQYLLNHPDFEFPKGKTLDRWLIKFNTRVTALRSRRNLGLSFRPMKEVPEEKIVVVPPLLRAKMTEQETLDEDFLLAYIVNDGYAEELIEWQAGHPDQKIHGFWDRSGVSDPYVVNGNLVFHQISEDEFVDKMRRCRGYVTTAGFESVCEAMYLGKPILMVPTGGHFEQRCNAIDASKAGAGIWSEFFDISRFIDYVNEHKTDPKVFREWVDSAAAVIGPLLTEVAYEKRVRA